MQDSLESKAVSNPYYAKDTLRRMNRKLKVNLIIDFDGLLDYFDRLRHGSLESKIQTVGNRHINNTLKYYISKEIEQTMTRIRQSCWKRFKRKVNITVSVCFDDSDKGSIISTNFREVRKARMDDKLRERREEFVEYFKSLGYGVYQKSGFNADDLIYSIVKDMGLIFDESVILTDDANLWRLCSRNVRFMFRFPDLTKRVFDNNLYRACLRRYGYPIPYNALLLYFCLCGDKARKLTGAGFSNEEFYVFLEEAIRDGAKVESLSVESAVEAVLRDKLSGEKLESALKVLESERYFYTKLQIFRVASPWERRKEVYLEHGFEDCVCFRDLYATTEYLKRKEEETGG